MNFVDVDFCCCWAYGCIYRHSCFSVKCCLYTAGSQKLAACGNSHIWRTALTSLNLHMWFKPHLLDFCDFAVGKVNDHVTPVMVMVMMMNNQAQAQCIPEIAIRSLENTPFQEEPHLFSSWKKKHVMFHVSHARVTTNTVTAPPPLDIYTWLPHGFIWFRHLLSTRRPFALACRFGFPHFLDTVWLWISTGAGMGLRTGEKGLGQIDGYLGTPVLVVRETKRKTKGKKQTNTKWFG